MGTSQSSHADGKKTTDKSKTKGAGGRKSHVKEAPRSLLGSVEPEPTAFALSEEKTEEVNGVFTTVNKEEEDADIVTDDEEEMEEEEGKHLLYFYLFLETLSHSSQSSRPRSFFTILTLTLLHAQTRNGRSVFVFYKMPSPSRPLPVSFSTLRCLFKSMELLAHATTSIGPLPLNAPVLKTRKQWTLSLKI